MTNRPCHLAVIERLEPKVLFAATYFVSPSGNDANAGDADHPWKTVQHAFDASTPGATVNVLAGRYRERATLHVSGNAVDGFITFQAQGRVILNGNGKTGKNIISMDGISYVRIAGFDIQGARVSDGSGIRLTGAGDHIELRNNTIHNITGSDAMGITVYGTDPAGGISNLVIDGNEIYKCQPAHSEALTLNGNVHDFQVTNNYVHDVNNIGIDFIGGEGTSPDPATDVARNGICGGNRVINARSKYGGGYAAGIYADGARDVVIENNISSRNDLGIEVGCEHAGLVATGIAVRDNLIFLNGKAGLAFGGYAQQVGRVQNCTFFNNTLYQNDTAHTGNGEIWMQFASGNLVENNLVDGGTRDVLLNMEAGAVGNISNYNLFYGPAGTNAARFVMAGMSYNTLSEFAAAANQEANSVFADPALADPSNGNLHVSAGSPAVDAGDPAFGADPNEVDIDGEPRVAGGRIDIGADELPISGPSMA